MRDAVDVAIVGGGLAGLTLALQLTRRRPDLSVTVVDRRRRPLPERTSTVGESFSELGSYYLRDVLGLSDHLEAHQLPKIGLRFFVGSAPDLADRLELGIQSTSLCDMRDGEFLGLPLRTHQVDRGRLENELTSRCAEAGVALLEGTRAAHVDLDPGGHHLGLEGDTDGRLDARWVVFADGVGPASGESPRPLHHRIRAAWFRAAGELDVGAWSAREDFLAAAPPGYRRLSTSHFMGRGFWAWVIPLPSGVTSVGVVADPSVVDLDVQDHADLLAWIRARDPRLSDELAAVPMADERIRTAELSAGVRQRCFHPDRWAVVGQAAGFVDVLYSPGADLIALGNSLVTELVHADGMRSGGLAGRCAVADRIFSGFAEGLAEIYRGQYAGFGDARIVGTKVVWDSAVYFGFNTMLFRHGLSTDPRYLASLGPELLTLRSLQSRVQGRFRRGDAVPLVPAENGSVEWGSVSWMMDAYLGARAQPGPAHVSHQLRRVLTSLEKVARRIEGTA